MKGQTSLLKRLGIFVTSLVVAVLIGFFPKTAQAVNATGRIVGTVSDSSGAIVPDAAITLTNQTTGASRRMQSDASGGFNFELLPIGLYSLRVERSGFKSFSENGITLQVDESRTIPVTLQPGNVTQEVVVTSVPVGVNLVDATVKEVVDQQRMVDLPLNGRSPLDLQLIMPGTAVDIVGVGHAQSQNNGLVVNGNRAASNYYLLDGVDFINAFQSTAPVFPAPDALHEFTMQLGQMSAAFGRDAGATVNAVTNSGTNQFHGTLFEFFRNTVLNANNYFSNKNDAPRPPYHLNQYGGSLGGPIRKDKTFFFVYAQQTSRRESQPIIIPTVLTPTERLGDFSDDCPGSACPIDPRTGQAFPNNVIPQNRIDPVAAAFVQAIMPLPNSGTRSYIFDGPTGTGQDHLDESQFVARIDQSFGAKDKVFGRYYYNDDAGVAFSGNLPGNFYDQDYRNQNLGLNWTHILSPTKVNSLTLGFDRTAHHFVDPIPRNWHDFGGPCNSLGCDRKFTIALFIPGSINSQGNSDYYQTPTTYQISDVLSWVKGRNSLNIGTDILDEAPNQFFNFLSDGEFFFQNNFSNNPLTDFLLGLPSYGRQDTPTGNELRYHEVSVYAQDDLKLTKDLTVNLGVRWEPFMPPTDNRNWRDCMDLTFTKQSVVFPQGPPGLLYPAESQQGRGGGSVHDAGCPRSASPNKMANMAPRVGLAWDPFGKGKTSVRAGYGVFWDNIRLEAWNRLPNTQPYTISRSDFSPGNVTNNFPASLSGDLWLTNAGLADPYPYSVPEGATQNAAFKYAYPVLTAYFPSSFNLAYVQQYNLGVEQEFAKDYTLKITYLGNKGSHLFMSHEYNWAVPLPFNVETPAQQLANYTARRRFSNVTCQGQPCYDTMERDDDAGWSDYNSLQITVNKQFTHGLTFLGSYVWGKTLDIGSISGEGGEGPRDPYNLNLDKGPSEFDIRNRFVTSFIWQVPTMKRFDNPIANGLLNGWELNGAVTVQSGFPFTVYSGPDTSLTGIGGETADPVQGVDPHLSTGRSHSQRVAQYFNTAAFQVAPYGTYGVTGRDSLNAPGLVNFDVSFFKEFRISERLGKLQFREENFNLFNHPNFGFPDSTVTDGAAFGQIFSAGDPRFIQFAVKEIF
jgi:hypothetical protein